MQLAEVKLYGVDGGELSVVHAANPGGYHYSSWEGVASSFDNDLSTKWLDLNVSKPDGSQHSVLVLTLASAAPVARYDLFTGNV
eukprot:2656211-Prymnesium_polylepis.1